MPEYLTLYSPAINWILQCIAYRAPEVEAGTSLYRNKKRNHRSANVEHCESLKEGFAEISDFDVCVSTSATANGNDGEMQDDGK